MNGSRREFLKSAGATLLVGATMPRVLDSAGFDPLEKNIPELQRAMAAGRLTSERLVSFYLDRIAAFDQSGPRVNAVISLNPAAKLYARQQLEAEDLKAGKLYLAVVDKRDPHLSARADLTLRRGE